MEGTGAGTYRRATVDISTRYSGLALKSPLIVGASPLTDEVDSARRLEDAGAAALVMRSLFEEEIRPRPSGGPRSLPAPSGSPGDPMDSAAAPTEYLERLRRLKAAVHIPVIASLNGTTDVGWTGFAHLLEEAGADALELNVYHVSTNLWASSGTLESQMLDFTRAIRMTVSIPITLKVYPYFSSLVSFARQLDDTGAAGLVIFNRCAQPDIDLDTLEVRSEPRLSTSSDLLERLYWVAMLAGRVEMSLAVTGGVHTAGDAIKAILAGAHSVQVVSALLANGVDHLRTMREGIERWMERHGHESLDSFRGRLSLENGHEPPFPRAGGLSPSQRWGT
jgi:dihydroorotate dehydrogenase (fumarate)